MINLTVRVNFQWKFTPGAKQKKKQICSYINIAR
jgi:hypothetical protein